MSIPESLATSLSGRYRIERELGAEGMATVYLALSAGLMREGIVIGPHDLLVGATAQAHGYELAWFIE